MPASATDIFRKRIRELRKSHGWTQEKTAEMSGIGYKLYQAYEQGAKDNPGLQTIEKIARGFGVETWQLVTPEPPKLKRKS